MLDDIKSASASELPTEPEHLRELARRERDYVIKIRAYGNQNDPRWELVNDHEGEARTFSGILKTNELQARQMLDRCASHGFFLRLSGPQSSLTSSADGCVFFRQKKGDPFPSILRLSRPDYINGFENEGQKVFYTLEITDTTMQNVGQWKEYIVGGQCEFGALPELIDAVGKAVDDPDSFSEAERVFAGEKVGNPHAIGGEPLGARVANYAPLVKRRQEPEVYENKTTPSPSASVIEATEMQPRVGILKKLRRLLGLSKG